MPEAPAREAESDFYFIDRAEPKQIAATVLKTRKPVKFKFDPISDIQALCLRALLRSVQPEETATQRISQGQGIGAVGGRHATAR